LQLLIAYQTAVTTNESSSAISKIAESANQVSIVCANGPENHNLRPSRTDCNGDDRMVQLPGLGIHRNIAVAA
jgi:hypothetical protein